MKNATIRTERFKGLSYTNCYANSERTGERSSFEDIKCTGFLVIIYMRKLINIADNIVMFVHVTCYNATAVS